MKSVYLIRNNNSQYKIGISKSTSKRLEQHQTGNPDDLKIINTYDSENASKIETALHNMYSHKRANREWFNLSLVEEVNFLTNCKKIDESINILKKMENNFV